MVSRGDGERHSGEIMRNMQEYLGKSSKLEGLILLNVVIIHITH